MDQLHAESVPNLYAIQRAVIQRVPGCRIWRTAFSTIYFPNFPTRFHVDTANLRGVMTCLAPMGNFTGGALIVPRYSLAIGYKPGDLLLLDAQQRHGNAGFKGKRLCVVFYCGGWAVDCGDK